MALADAVQGALRPSQQIVWAEEDDTPVDLTGATITARIQPRPGGATRTAAGTFTVTTPAAGVFRWDYDAADVEDAGDFWVQFSAAFASGPTPGRTLITKWRVQPAI